MMDTSQAKIIALTQKLKSQQIQEQTYQSYIQSFQQEIQSLQQTNYQNQQIIDSYKHKYENVSRELISAKDLMQRATFQNSELIRTIESQNLQIERGQSQLNNLQSLQIGQEFQGKQSGSELQQQKLNRLTQQTTYLSNQVVEQQNLNSQLTLSVSQLNNQIKTLMLENQGLSNSLDVMQTNVQIALKGKEQQSELISNLQQMIAEKDAIITDMQQQKAQEKILQSLTSYHQQKTAQTLTAFSNNIVSTGQPGMEQVQEQIAIMQQNLRKAEQNVKDKTLKEGQLISQIQELSAENDGLRVLKGGSRQLEKLQEDYQVLESDRDQLEAFVKELQHQNQAMNEQMDGYDEMLNKVLEMLDNGTNQNDIADYIKSQMTSGQQTPGNENQSKAKQQKGSPIKSFVSSESNGQPIQVPVAPPPPQHKAAAPKEPSVQVVDEVMEDDDIEDKHELVKINDSAIHNDPDADKSISDQQPLPDKQYIHQVYAQFRKQEQVEDTPPFNSSDKRNLTTPQQPGNDLEDLYGDDGNSKEQDRYKKIQMIKQQIQGGAQQKPIFRPPTNGGFFSSASKVEDDLEVDQYIQNYNGEESLSVSKGVNDVVRGAMNNKQKPMDLDDLSFGPNV